MIVVIITVVMCKIVVSQAAQDRQVRVLKRSADVLLKDEEYQKGFVGSQQGDGTQGYVQPELSGLTESHTEEGADDALADEDDMEEEVVGIFQHRGCMVNVCVPGGPICCVLACTEGHIRELGNCG